MAASAHGGEAVEEPAMEAAAAPRSGEGAGEAAAPTYAPRKIIRNGQIQLSVEDYRSARRRIESIVEARGGFVFSSNVQHSAGHVASAQIEFRVPSDQFRLAFDAVAEQGEVMAESSTSQDITAQYYDLKARLSNARRLETRLLELVASDTDGVTDLLEVERELARVREQIERHQGTLRLYDSQTELSTLSVGLYIDRGTVASVPATFGEDASRTLAGSWAALASGVRAAALFVVSLLPWLPVLALFGFIALRVRRSRLAPGR